MFQVDHTKIKNSKRLSERMTHYKVPGVSIAVINDYKLEWSKPYGIIKTGGNKPVTTETYFQAASTSKLGMAAIVLHFVEKGILNLDEDVNTYLKSWKIPENDFTRKREEARPL
jgi:CubicO group peptidase (beta-lactamase class C family)